MEIFLFSQFEYRITTDGVYKTKSNKQARQMYRCHGGNHRFSETRYSDLYKKQGSFKEYEIASKIGCLWFVLRTSS